MSVVTDECMNAAMTAFYQSKGGFVTSMRAALAVVAPLIAKAEQERCAVIAENHEWFVGGIGTTAPGSGQAKAIAAAIRALGDET